MIKLHFVKIWAKISYQDFFIETVYSFADHDLEYVKAVHELELKKDLFYLMSQQGHFPESLNDITVEVTKREYFHDTLENYLNNNKHDKDYVHDDVFDILDLDEILDNENPMPESDIVIDGYCR